MANFLTRNFILFFRKTCFLLLSALLLLPLYSCKKSVEYFDYVSEQRNNIFLAQTDDFYLRVKQMLLEEGEVSDAIGRLTDKPYFDTLSYEERQRYTLSISEKYLRALERFRRECPFDALQAGQKGE